MPRRASLSISTLTSLLAGGFVATLVLATGACSSLPDLHFADGNDEGGGGEGGPFGDGSSGNDGNGGMDGSADTGTDGPAPGCIKTGPEVCDDGIDNDCNGHTDCDDTACQAGFACTDPAPTGWDLVGFAASTRPTCPTGLGAASDVDTVTGTGAGTCTCQCSASAGSTACNAGQATVVASDQAACTGGSTDTRMINANAAACTALSSSLTIPNGTAFVEVIPPPPPAACDAATTLGAPPVTNGRVCAPPARVGKGCAGTKVCAPKPTGMAYCAAKAGTQTCPSAFPTLNTVGTGTTDTRACNACTCAPQTSCVQTATVYTAGNCVVAGAEKSDALTTTCASPTAKNVIVTAYKSVSGGTGCAPSGFNSATTGTLTFAAAQETVCCK